MIQLGIIQSIALQRVLIVTHLIKCRFDLQMLPRFYGWQKAPRGMGSWMEADGISPKGKWDFIPGDKASPPIQEHGSRDGETQLTFPQLQAESGKAQL